MYTLKFLETMLFYFNFNDYEFMEHGLCYIPKIL